MMPIEVLVGTSAVLLGNVEKRAVNPKDGLAAFILFQNPVREELRRIGLS